MRVQAEAFDERELKAAANRRGASSGPAPRGPSTIVPASAAPAAAVALLVGGAGSLMAPVDLSVAGDLLALGAVALGGWLLGRGPRHDAGAGELLRAAMAERWIVTDERREVIRAALAVASISGRDDPAERARRAGLVAAAVEPRADGGDDGSPGRADLHAVGGESLDPAADADELAGARGLAEYAR